MDVAAEAHGVVGRVVCGGDLVDGSGDALGLAEGVEEGDVVGCAGSQWNGGAGGGKGGCRWRLLWAVIVTMTGFAFRRRG